MADIGECQDCNHKFFLQGTDLQNIIGGAGCPNCGSHQVYRGLPNGIPDDMQLREDLIEPGDDQKMKGNPLEEGTLGGWQNRMKRDESFPGGVTGKTAAVVEAIPHQQAGIHFGPSGQLARHGIAINGEQFPNPQEIAARYSPMNPSWDRAPVILEHPDPQILELARQMVESGNHTPLAESPYAHNVLYNVHKETVQPHPNGLSADVVLGLGALDTYLNDQRVRSLVTKPTDLPWDGNPVTIGAQSPEELAAAKRVLTEGSSNPAREYQMNQRQGKTAEKYPVPFPIGPLTQPHHVNPLLRGIVDCPNCNGVGCEGCKETGKIIVPRNLEHTYENVNDDWVDPKRAIDIGGYDLPEPDAYGPYHQGSLQQKLAQYRQGRVIYAAFPSGSDQWRMGKTGRGFLFPDGRVVHWHVDPAMGGWPTHIDAAKMMGISPTAGQHFEVQPDGSVSVYAQGPEREQYMQQILAAHPYFKDQSGWALSSIQSHNKRVMDTRNQDIYMPWTVTADVVPTVAPQDISQQQENAYQNAPTPNFGADPYKQQLLNTLNAEGNDPGKWGIIGPAAAIVPGLVSGGEALGVGGAAEGVDPAIAAPEAGVDASGGMATGEGAAAGGEGQGLGGALQKAKGLLHPTPGVAAAEGGAGATAGTGAFNLIKGAIKSGVGKATAAGQNYIKQQLGMGGYPGAVGGPGGAPFGFSGINGQPIDESYLPTLSKTADIETPTSNPDIPGLQDGDFQYQDPHEFAAGDNTNNQFNPNLDSSVGGAQAYHKSPAADLFRQHLPVLLHYYNSPESGAHDPRVLAVHHALEKEFPGYLALADDTGIHYHHHHHHGALPQPGISPTCPQCGGVTDAHGHCPQCGYTPPQQQPAQATGVTPLPPTPGFQPTSALDQGPQTDEQKAAVAELLEQEGRAKEIPLMLQQGYLYAKELSRVQHKINQPPQNVPPQEQVQPPVEQTPPGANMPMPGMQSPQMPLSSIQAAINRFSVDSIAPKCPRCGSHTTGTLTEKGDCRCHACGKQWNVKKLQADKIGKTATDNVAPKCPRCGSHTTGVLNDDGECQCHACGKQWNVKPLEANKIGKTADLEHQHSELHNVIDAPAAEQSGQRDISQEQDTSGYWKDSAGNRLVAGQQYEMHSSKYEIPDIIRIESIKPDEILFTIQSKFGLDPRDKVSRHEAQLEQLSFVPYNGNADAPSEEFERPTNDGNDAYEGPGQVSDLSTPPKSNFSHVEAALPVPGIQTGPEPTPWVVQEPEPEEVPEEVEETEENNSKESSLHCSSCGGTDITSEMRSPEVTHYDCYKCGHAWDIKEDDNITVTGGILPENTRTWLRADSSGPIAHIGNERDMSGHSRDIRNISKRYAGAKFTPAQQKEFINEKGNARNKDRLNLTDTHYESRSKYKTRNDGVGNAYEVDDDHLALGI